MTEKVKVDIKKSLVGVFLIFALSTFMIFFLFSLYKSQLFFYIFSLPIGLISTYLIIKLLENVFYKSDRIICNNKELRILVDGKFKSIGWTEIVNIEHKVLNSNNKYPEQVLLIKTNNDRQYLVSLNGLNKQPNEILSIISKRLKITN